MKCPEGFCRDAEHCMQGGRCEDAVGELTPLVTRATSREEEPVMTIHEHGHNCRRDTEGPTILWLCGHEPHSTPNLPRLATTEVEQ